MINRLQVEYQRFFNRDVKIGMLSDSPPLVQEKIVQLDTLLGTFCDRAKQIKDCQHLLLAVLQIVSGIDFSVKPTTKKDPNGDEQTSPELLACRKLAQHTGSQKIKRVRDGEIVRPGRLNRDYAGYPAKRPGLFFFSTAPKPGVYFMPLDGIGIDPNPAYTPIETEAKTNGEKS
ncbi:MAG: hypothetical protein JW807_16625 [Spirochaetes bacterium]|nr:hypothetical protein [Spirochaetota bacterium]